MLEADIRRALLRHVRSHIRSDLGDAFVEEFVVCGGLARSDVVVVNGVLHGYEIKSAADRLTRLPAQMAAYQQVFEYVTVVAAPRHLERAVAIVPPWCGLLGVYEIDGEVMLRQERVASPNPAWSALAAASLLWRNEALLVLEAWHMADGVRSRPRSILARRLAECLPPHALAASVRDALKAREGWRAQR